MNKIRIIQQFIDKKVTLQQAMEYLNCSDRTIYRYKNKLDFEGPPGFIHGLKNRPSNNGNQRRKLEYLKEKAHKKIYDGFGPTFLAEKLSEEYGYEINHETLRLAMIRRGLRQPKRQKHIIMRSSRERRPSYGMLVQFDGSYHDRFENGSSVCLLCSIDDATGKVISMKFAEGEGLEDIIGFWKEYMLQYGKPGAIYVDCHATYKVNHPNDQFTYEMKTRFQKAVSKLGTQLIYAKSPQGKGRVERGFGTHQDRLVKELRLAGIKTIDKANEFLESYYIPKHNTKFSVKAKEDGDKHTRLTQNEIDDFDLLFAKETERTVKYDGTIRYNSTVYQIPKGTILKKGRKIIIKETLSGLIGIYVGERKLSYQIRYIR